MFPTRARATGEKRTARNLRCHTQESLNFGLGKSSENGAAGSGAKISWLPRARARGARLRSQREPAPSGPGPGPGPRSQAREPEGAGSLRAGPGGPGPGERAWAQGPGPWGKGLQGGRDKNPPVG